MKKILNDHLMSQAYIKQDPLIMANWIPDSEVNQRNLAIEPQLHIQNSIDSLRIVDAS